MNDVGLMIIATEARDSVAKETGIEDKLRSAMRVAKNHWMVTDRDEQFRGALAAVLSDATCSDSDKERLKDEIKCLRTLSAILQGVPVDLTAIQAPDNPIGIKAMWDDVCSEVKP